MRVKNWILDQGKGVFLYVGVASEQGRVDPYDQDT